MGSAAKSKALTDEEWLLVQNTLAHRLSEMASHAITRGNYGLAPFHRTMLLDHERKEWDAIHRLLGWSITP